MRHEEDRRYSDEIEKFYQEARCKNLEEIQRRVQFYRNMSLFKQFCLKVGFSRESSRAVGYKMRLEELLQK